MRVITLLLMCLSLSACGRSLTPNETAFAKALFSSQLDTTKVTLNDGLIAGSFTTQRKARPRVTCSERLYPPITDATVTVSAGAMALFHRVRFRNDLYRKDFLSGLPDQFTLNDAMLFAHEMTHVWQWQNRKTTGYHPLKAASEHSKSDDPYLFDPNSASRFLDHGYEQQGAIMEEYICCRVLAPDAARTHRLHAMLSDVFPVADLNLKLANRVTLPWNGVKIPGICS